MPKILTGTAFITGAAQGIGKATAVSLAACGAEKLALSDIDMPLLEETCSEIRQQFPDVEVLALKVDVGCPEEVNAGVEAAVKLGNGRLDIAVNNAAFEDYGFSTPEVTEEAFHKCMNVDLYGVWRCQKAQIIAMMKNEDLGPRRGRGTIINVSSVHGMYGPGPLDNNTAYTAAKHGVTGLTRADGNAYGRFGIRINAVCPGAIMTAMAKGYLEDDTDGNLLETMSKMPMPRWGEPEEVADCISFLASPMSSYMNSTTVLVDGGFAAM